MTQFKEQLLFETPRLLCRQLSCADTNDMHAAYSDPEAMRWVDDGLPMDRETCVKWIEVTLKNYASRGYGMSALVSKETGSVVGFCGLVHPDGQPEAEIKYTLLRTYWGAGLATEAASGMLKYGQKDLQIQEVIATTSPENTASRRVLLKIGMTEAPDRIENDGSLIKVFKWTSQTDSCKG